jgi:hypothetical protein
VVGDLNNSVRGSKYWKKSSRGKIFIPSTFLNEIPLRFFVTPKYNETYLRFVPLIDISIEHSLTILVIFSRNSLNEDPDGTYVD